MSEFANAEPMPSDEARLLDELGRALGPDPLPAGLIGRAEALLDLVDLDHDLAVLLDEAAAQPAGVRGPSDTATRLAFEVPGGAVALEVAVEHGRLFGQLLVGAVATVALERLAGGATTVPVDAFGRFTFDISEPGPVRLVLSGGPGTGLAKPVATDWFALTT